MKKQWKKRLQAVFLAGSMLMTAALPAYAADKQSMELTVNKAAQYTMTIPRDQNEIIFGAEHTTIGTLSVTGDIGTKQQVQVTVDKTDFADSKDKTNSFPFALQNNGSGFSSAVWTSEQVRAETPTGYDLEVYIPTTTWAGTQAGTYNATLTFQAELQDIR
ncbi:MAG: cation transporter [Eubacteriales bacterium]|nr:cation transporter [Eubacteriales bacterium]